MEVAYMSRMAYEANNQKYIALMDKKLKELPPYVKSYIYHIENRILPRTRYAYVCDIYDFFTFLANNNAEQKCIKEISLSYLNQLNVQDFDEYLHDLRKRAGEQAESRKISAIKSLFTYLCEQNMISNKDAYSIKSPKIHKKETLTYMSKDEVKKFLNAVESGICLNERQMKYHEKQKTRDVALFSLLLTTGIRVSECATLDVKDLDLDSNSIFLVRKGNKESNVYFPQETADRLEDYLEERKDYLSMSDPLFLNRNFGRMSVRSIERLVKKYAQPLIVGTKNITPHKLRSTYGMGLYESTDDLYLVAEVLGHESVETTKSYYTTVTEDRKKKAGNMELW